MLSKNHIEPQKYLNTFFMALFSFNLSFGDSYQRDFFARRSKKKDWKQKETIYKFRNLEVKSVNLKE